MATKLQNLIGWVLLILGLAIIFYAIFNSYNIFAGKFQPPTVFKIEEKEKTISPQKEVVQGPKEETEKMVGEKVQEQLGTMIPKDALPKLLNLVTWSILAGILIFGGTQISSLGINLLKK